MSEYEDSIIEQGSRCIKRDILEFRDYFSIAEEDLEHKRELEILEANRKKFPNTTSAEARKGAAASRITNEKEILSGVEYQKIFEDEETREMLKARGREIVEAIAEKGIEELVFLDKSARLIGYFISKSWEAMKPGEPKPRISFVNIGTEKTNDLDRESVKKLQKELVSVFGEKFRDKKICIIDEVIVSGMTLVFATLLFEKTYKDSEIYSEWFGTSGAYYNAVKDDVNQLIKKEPPRITDINHFYAMDKGVVEPEERSSILADPWQKDPYNDQLGLRNRENIFWRQQLKKLAYELFDERN